MTIEEIRKNAPDGATHYAEDDDGVFYLTHVNILGYFVISAEYYLDEYEIHLVNPKPL